MINASDSTKEDDLQISGGHVVGLNERNLGVDLFIVEFAGSATLLNAYRVVKASIRGKGQFGVAEDNDGSVCAPSTLRGGETDRVVEAQPQSAMGLEGF
jgi:hypothetical protein